MTLMTKYTGWLGPEAEKRAFERLQKLGLGIEFPDVVNLVDDELEKVFRAFGDYRPYTWDLERSLYEEGKLPWAQIPVHTQDTGNCVAAALGMAGMKRHVIELSLGREEEKFREWYIPWIYAVSRNQVGGGIRGGGSTGAWGAEAVNKYGVLFADDTDVPPYAGTSDDWGHRRNVSDPKYQKFFDIASDNKVQVIRLTDVEEMVSMLEAGRPLTIASSQGFDMEPVEYKGYHCFRPSGSWYHQMHITDVMLDPFPAFYRCNQWGANAHGEPLNGETPGGAWNHVEDVEDELRSGDCEVYAYWDFEGEAGEPDPGIL